MLETKRRKKDTFNCFDQNFNELLNDIICGNSVFKNRFSRLLEVDKLFLMSNRWFWIPCVVTTSRRIVVTTLRAQSRLRTAGNNELAKNKGGSEKKTTPLKKMEK